MNERDRLIELLQNVPTDYEGNRGVGTIADYLLANGVVVLPCNIEHEALFAIVDLYNRKKIVGQTIAKYEIDCIIIGHSQKPIYRCCNASNEWEDFDGEQIGKTVFLAREEAESALKGGADNE